MDNYNNETVFTFYYYYSNDELDDSEFNKTISAINCVDYINGEHWEGKSKANKELAIK